MLDKPNLLIIGAMKASTTLLHDYLGRHPQIWFPEVKEPCYFSDPFDAKDSNEYQKLFADSPPEATYIGEASTTYSRYPHNGPVARRVFESLGTPKMLYILRDPVERTISHYRHSYLAGYYPQGLTIREALQCDPVLLDTSRYAQQLDQYYEVFDPSDLFVFPTEHFSRETERIRDEILDFLGLPPSADLGEEVPRLNTQEQMRRSLSVRRILKNEALARAASAIVPKQLKALLESMAPLRPAPPATTEDDRAHILEQVADDLQKLESMVACDLSCWPSIGALDEHHAEAVPP